MKIELKKWSIEDKESLIRICNTIDRNYLSDRLPNPYTNESAEWWLNIVKENEGKTGIFREIIVDGKIIGTISVEQKEDVYRKDAEIGYYLLPEEYSKGIMTEAVRQICETAFEKLDIIRITGLVPSQLSGGQKQRVGIARALSSDPKILLSDEATSALDPETTQATLQLLKKINKELGLTIVMITHEMDVVKQICNRVVVMNKGVVVEEGDVLEVFRDPKNEVTQAMLGTALAARTIPASMVERVKKVLNTPGENGRKNHLIRLTFVGSSTTEPVLSRACSKFDLDFNILLGQVDEIQSESYGTLTIVMEGTTENFRQALNYIAERGVRVEELTNVI